MHLRNRLIATLAVMTLIGAVAISSGPGSRAQEASPAAEVAGHPIHIHSGNCADGVGDVIQGLTDVVGPSGTTVGQESAIVAETSFTTVPMALDAILAEDHAINVHESQANIGNYIACGDLGGVLNDQGALVVGLSEQNDSGESGIAFLVPNAADPTQTDVSVFLAEDLSGAGLDDTE
jgi:hypothetical protein